MRRTARPCAYKACPRATPLLRQTLFAPCFSHPPTRTPLPFPHVPRQPATTAYGGIKNIVDMDDDLKIALGSPEKKSKR